MATLNRGLTQRGQPVLFNWYSPWPIGQLMLCSRGLKPFLAKAW
jgi:hypothetical protein